MIYLCNSDLTIVIIEPIANELKSKFIKFLRQKGKIEEFQKAKSPVVIRVRKGTMDNINDDNLISMKPLRKAHNLRRALSPTSGTETFLILNTNNS